LEKVCGGETPAFLSSNVAQDRSFEVKVLDSTLREGEQCIGVSFTKRQRVQLAWMLDYFGVDAIEISPIISTDHFEACREIIGAGLRSEIIAHVRALPTDVEVASRCNASFVAMYHSVSDLHLSYKLKVTREEGLKRSVKAVRFAKSLGLKVRFTLEDATRADRTYLRDFVVALENASVDRLSIPDTLGMMQPNSMRSLIGYVKSLTRLPVDVHCHNDFGLALANSLAGVEAGADQVHATIDGIGERVGIVSLAELTMALCFLYGIRKDFKFEMLKELSETVSKYTRSPTPASKPIVGRNAHTHKAGTHIAAVLKNPEAYEPFAPSLVGGRRRVVFGELSGKNGGAFLLNLFGLSASEENAIKVAKSLKLLKRGDLFELDFDGLTSFGEGKDTDALIEAKAAE
jgi:isopropylmalate/homocitrate/citramalate synthase